MNTPRALAAGGAERLGAGRLEHECDRVGGENDALQAEPIRIGEQDQNIHTLSISSLGNYCEPRFTKSAGEPTGGAHSRTASTPSPGSASSPGATARSRPSGGRRPG